MPSLKGTETEQNLKEAFAGESQASRRYLYFARKADVEGFNDVAAVFRSTAEGETGHAYGNLEYLEEVGDPATGKQIAPTGDNLKAAIASETHEYTDVYPRMARVAGRVPRRNPKGEGELCSRATAWQANSKRSRAPKSALQESSSRSSAGLRAWP
jgi:rubrerythrin